MSRLSENLSRVKERIQNTAKSCDVNCHPKLIAVSKTRPWADIETLYQQGQHAFGENYLQEAIPKIVASEGYNIEWHYIGAIQSNKTATIAEHFNWVHTVDRLKIARRLSEQRPSGLAPLNICIQINIDNESSKAGIGAEQAHDLIEQIHSLPNLCIRGLMAIPAPLTASDMASSNILTSHQRMAALLAELRQTWPELDTLSLGMSADLEPAIAAGATMVRIGTDIFGARQSKTK